VDGLFLNDKLLGQSLPSLTHLKYSKPVSEEMMHQTRDALLGKGYQCTIANDENEALNLLIQLPLRDSTIFCCASITLQQIGFIHYLKEHKDSCKRNFKAESVAAQMRGDFGEAEELMRMGMSADYVFTSVPALSVQGDLTVCCLTGTRTGCFSYAANKLYIIVGSNKIVESYEECLKRIDDYCVPLESARVRVVYSSVGIKGSKPHHFAAIRGADPFQKEDRIHVIICKQSLGY